MERIIPLTSEQTDEAERRSDQGVWNGAMAEAAFAGCFTEQPVDEDAPRPAQRSKHDKLPSRKAKPQEVSGQEMTRRIDNATPPLDPEERQEIRRGEGHRLFVLERGRLAYQNALDKTEGDPRAQRVLLRKLAEDK